jgi:O-antigen ligase
LVLGFGRNATNLSLRVLALLAGSSLLILFAILFANIDILKAPAVSKFLAANPLAPEGTAYWRQIWWQNLTSHVVDTNPLLGLGFGENLSVYNPFVTAESLRQAFAVRSPHNFNITVFARMGVLGAVLWGAILIAGIGGLFSRIWKGRDGNGPYSRRRIEELNFWMLMLVSTWVNASFGVLMEGPVLGIWFWFALGFATRRAAGDPGPANQNFAAHRYQIQRKGMAYV